MYNYSFSDASHLAMVAHCPRTFVKSIVSLSVSASFCYVLIYIVYQSQSWSAFVSSSFEYYIYA